MIRTLSRLSIVIIFALIGGFSTYIIKAKYFHPSPSSENSTEKDDSASNDGLPVLSSQDFTKSTKPAFIETFEKVFDSYTFDEILEIQDARLREALLEEYLSSASLDELPSLFESLYKQPPGQYFDPWGRNRNFLNFAASIWMKRDFESAKTFIIEKFDSDQTQERYMMKYHLSSVLFPAWMSENPEECTAYLGKLIGDNPSVILNSAIHSLINDHPQAAFSLLEKGTSGMSGDIYIYGRIAGSWYEKEPEAALETIFKIVDQDKRSEALISIVEKMAATQPEDALALIRKEIPEDNRSAGIYTVISHFSSQNQTEALDLIRQGNFSDDERNIAYKAFGASFNPSELKNVLDNPALLISEEERHQIIRQIFGSVESKKYGNPQYGNFQMHMPSAFHMAHDDSDIEIKASLFSELNTDDKIELIKTMASGYGYYNNNNTLALMLLDQVPDEQKNESIVKSFLQKTAYSNPDVAAKYYVEKVYGKDFGDKESIEVPQYGRGEKYIFIDIMEQFAAKDPKGAMTWAESLTDEDLRKQAMFAIMTKDAVKEPIKALEYLQSLDDQELAKETFLRTTRQLAHNDIQSLSKLLVQAKDESWVKEAAVQTISQVHFISEDASLDFIDSLYQKPAVQDEVRLQYIGLMQHPSPSKALNIALDISDKKKRNDSIKNILIIYEQKDPAGAKRWKEEHPMSTDSEN